MKFYNIYIRGYCHGSSKNNTGACSAIILDSENRLVDSVVQKHYSSTKNRLEIMAAIAGLEYFNSPQNIIIYSDLEYVINMINIWIKGWKKRGWAKRGDKEIVHLDLVRKLDDLTSRHNSVKASWVKGGEFNEMAKQLAEFAVKPDDFDAEIGVTRK